METKKYQPSNGSEGMWFTDKYCMNCFHCDPDPDGDKQCVILCNSMCYTIKDEEYPKEWIYNEEGKPTCTAYKHWDWDKMENPDDLENEHYVQPHNPNQTTLS